MIALVRLTVSGQKLQNLLLQFDYMVINDKPTRVTKDTSTLIDLVISSNRNPIKNTRTVELGISDHMLVHASVQTKIKRPPPTIIKAVLTKILTRPNFLRTSRRPLGPYAKYSTIWMIVIGHGNTSLVKYVTSMRPSVRSRLDASPYLGFLQKYAI